MLRSFVTAGIAPKACQSKLVFVSTVLLSPPPGRRNLFTSNLHPQSNSVHSFTQCSISIPPPVASGPTRMKAVVSGQPFSTTETGARAHPHTHVCKDTQWVSHPRPLAGPPLLGHIDILVVVSRRLGDALCREVNDSGRNTACGRPRHPPPASFG